MNDRFAMLLILYESARGKGTRVAEIEDVGSVGGTSILGMKCQAWIPAIADVAPHTGNVD